jgi:hypothetical protein
LIKILSPCAYAQIHCAYGIVSYNQMKKAQSSPEGIQSTIQVGITQRCEQGKEMLPLASIAIKEAPSSPEGIQSTIQVGITQRCAQGKEMLP